MLSPLLQSALLNAAEGTLNELLQRDPVALQRLQALQGRCLELQLQGTGICFQLYPHGRGVLLQSRLESHPDARLRVPPHRLLALLGGDGDNRVTAAGHQEISGDTQLAEALLETFTHLDLDWEGLLAGPLGELVGHQVAEGIRAGQAYWTESQQRFNQDLSAYLHEELRLLPCAPELQAQLDDIDRLRLDVDRLEARIQRLQSRRGD